MRLLLCPAVLFLSLGVVSVDGQTAGGSETLLRMPETLIDGLQPLTAKALETSPRVIDARLKMLTAEAREEESRSLTRPRADISLNAGYHENDASNTASFQTYYSATTSQPLWHWNALDNQKRIAQIQRRLAENDYDEARRSLVLSIRERYCVLVLQKLNLAEAEASRERRIAHLKVSSDQARSGQLSADVLTAEQLDVRADETHCDRKRMDFQRALREFAVLNGLSSFSGDALPKEIPGVPTAALTLFNTEPPAATLQNVVPAALARPEAELATARLNEEITRVRMRPMVNLAAGANQDQTSGADQTAVLEYYGGLSVHWNIFDGFATRAAVRQARVLVRQNEKALAEARTALGDGLADGAADVALETRELQITEERFILTASRQKMNDDLHKEGRLADADWQEYLAATQVERTNLYKLRAQLILTLAEQQLLRERATKPSKEIPFP